LKHNEQNNNNVRPKFQTGNSVVSVAAAVKCNGSLSQFPVNRAFRVDIGACTAVQN